MVYLYPAAAVLPNQRGGCREFELPWRGLQSFVRGVYELIAGLLFLSRLQVALFVFYEDSLTNTGKSCSNPVPRSWWNRGMQDGDVPRRRREDIAKNPVGFWLPSG